MRLQTSSFETTIQMSDDVDNLLELFQTIVNSVEARVEHFDSDDRIIGTYIRYKSGLEVFHPYIPLQIYRGDGSIIESSRPTRIELLMGGRFKTRYDTEH